ncbi:MAG: DUF433 domain-containing protein [Candidatus Accumulibacter phosphatis]|uniref:DUF433 domain-containing protein n=1 Tax=Candidatus Accumulibacter contiguus TaxID=2954381 RepID=UPI002FC35EE6
MASSQEAEMKTFDHITRDPAMLGGQPTVRGMRLTVRRVVYLFHSYPLSCLPLSECSSPERRP